ncbi:MAG: ribonuclease J [Chloroflexi bacterium]|nr:ribonuclease J [Chloroflexota bacterium]
MLHRGHRLHLSQTIDGDRTPPAGVLVVRLGQEIEVRRVPTSSLRAVLLGGVGEVGKNSTLFEFKDDLLLVDVGVKFPEPELHGVDLVIPDYTYVKQRSHLLRGIIFTHGHEDHIGALPYLIMQLDGVPPVPIYGTPLTLGLIEVKLREHGLLDRVQMFRVQSGRPFEVGGFEVEAIDVNHSVPGAVGYALTTEAGTCFHTGDFKFDPSPPDGKPTDRDALRRLGDRGVLALFSDCVRVEQPGWTPSERVVDESLAKIIEDAPGRVIITTFASNLDRLRRVALAAHRLGRKVGVAGRSMDANLHVAGELGYLEVPDDVWVDLRDLSAYDPARVVLLTTGSQGEPTSVLSRMAQGDHPLVRVMPEDTVVFSASPVPGNEESVSRSIDNLFRRGARVIYRAVHSGIHVSGHASREELKEMIRLLRPRYCVPIHAEYRMQYLYRDLAREEGVPDDRIIIADIGEVIDLKKDGAGRAGTVPSGSVLVDGLSVGGVTQVVLRDRGRLAADGVLIATIVVDRETGELVAGPDLVSRGFVDPAEADILEAARARVHRALERQPRGAPEYGFLVGKIREVLNGYVYDRTHRRPMIIPVVTEV